MALFETQWNTVKIDSKQADEVDQRLLDVKNALEKGHDMKQVKGKLSSLSESLLPMIPHKILLIQIRIKSGFSHWFRSSMK